MENLFLFEYNFIKMFAHIAQVYRYMVDNTVQCTVDNIPAN